MTWRTHVIGGLVSLWIVDVVGLVVPVGTDSTSLALAILFALLGSLLPDLDARESKLSNLQIGGIAPLKPAAWLLSRSLGHRGPLHSLLALFIVGVCFGVPISWLLDPFAGVGLALGYLSHLLLDACTKSGVPLYWPDTRRVHLLPKRLRFVTGSTAEDGLFILLAIVAASFLLTHFFPFSSPYESQNIYQVS
jgi:inner membrane protein